MGTDTKHGGDMAEPSIGETIGRNIRTLRDAGLLTQEEVAEQVRMSPSQYNLLENGKVKRPHPSTLRKIADFFGVAPQDLRSPERILAPKVAAPFSPAPEEGSEEEQLRPKVSLPLDIDAITQEVMRNAKPESPRELREALNEAYAHELQGYSVEELLSLKDDLLQEAGRLGGRKTREELRQQSPEELRAQIAVMENANAVLRVLERIAGPQHA
jgi:transcriptional regulator with XRE-family HTH domain